MQFHTYMINCLGNITSEIHVHGYEYYNVHGYEYYTCTSAVGFWDQDVFTNLIIN